MFDSAHYQRLGLGRVHERVMSGLRLSPEDGEALFACPDILAVGALAHHVRTRMHGAKTYFVRNRHINYSNICVNHCRFCAFRRDAGQEDAFSLSKEAVLQRALDDNGHPFAEIHIVGGCDPSLRLDWFEDLFRSLRKLRPHAVLKAFTVAEIAHFARMEGCSVKDVLIRLKEAGIAMLTGGGAEIFNPAVRRRLCPEKITGSEYLAIAGKAHALGLASNCSMLFGHIESHRDRVEHLCALRQQQDASGGFVCFIPLAFQWQNNNLARELKKEGQSGGEMDFSAQGSSPSPLSAPADSGLDRLRTIAVARLLLDNIPHIKAYWVMLGVKTAQAALHFGADDLDGTIMEEHIGHMAGAEAAQALTRTQLETMIQDCGLTPVNRDALFRALPVTRKEVKEKLEGFSHEALS